MRINLNENPFETMNGDNTFAWFRLFSTRGYGPASIHSLYAKLVAHKLGITDLFELDENRMTEIYGAEGVEIYNKLHSEDFEDVQNQYESLRRREIIPIHREHELYPARILRLMLKQAPAMLFAKGNTSLIGTPGIAVVGSRDADELALRMAMDAAGAAAEAGFNVVSGYARGIDTAAHIGALRAQGTTTIILGYGIDHYVPKAAFSRYNLMKDALILSQFHPREVWKNNYGMLRNSIIVGLSKAVIVIKAGDKSGTINTGNTALKWGNPLLVMSPELFTKGFEGNARLIENGGKEVKDLQQLNYELRLINSAPEDTGNRSRNPQGMLPI